MDWTTDPRAVALLASIRVNPPARARREERSAQSFYAWYAPVGPLVDALEAVWKEHLAAALNHARSTEDYSGFDAFCEQPRVTDVIDAALSQPVEQAEAA